MIEPATAPRAPDDTARLLSRVRGATSLEEALSARNALIERHLHLVASAVATALPAGFDTHRNDAGQEAACALMEVSASLGPERADHFHAYAWRSMVNRIRAYVMRQTAWSGSGRVVRAQRKIWRHLTAEGIAPEAIGDRALAQAIGVSPVLIQRLRPWIAGGRPLETELVQEQSGPEESPVAHASAGQDRAQLQMLLQKLPALDRFVLVRLYGLEGPAQSAQDIAGIMGCSPQRVHFRSKRALARLRCLWRD